MSAETLRSRSFVRKSSIKLPGGGGGGLIFFQAFLMGGGGWGCLKEKGGLFNLAKCINGSKVSPARTCGYRALYYFF